MGTKFANLIMSMIPRDKTNFMVINTFVIFSIMPQVQKRYMTVTFDGSKYSA